MGDDLRVINVKPQLQGDCTRLSDLPNIAASVDVPEEVRPIAQLMGWAAKTVGAWVGVSIMDAARFMGEPGIQNTPLTLPLVWVHINDDPHNFNPILLLFREAAQAGLVTIHEGYALPTQKLANLLCSVLE